MEATATEQLTVTRTFQASRQRVFRAWTDPELMMRWFVDDDGEMTVCEIDLREGGSYRFEGTGDGKQVGRSRAPTWKSGRPSVSSTRGSGNTIPGTRDSRGATRRSPSSSENTGTKRSSGSRTSASTNRPGARGAHAGMERAAWTVSSGS